MDTKEPLSNETEDLVTPLKSSLKRNRILIFSILLLDVVIAVYFLAIKTERIRPPEPKLNKNIDISENKVYESVILPIYSPPEIDIPYDWKTYTNTKVDYSFRYPAEWELGLNPSWPENTHLDFSDIYQDKVLMPGDSYEYAGYSIRTEVWENPENLDPIHYYFKDYRKPEPAENLETVGNRNIEQIVISGRKGIIYNEGSAPSSGPTRTSMLSYNRRIYTISYSAMAHENTHFKYIDVFYQVLSTFKLQ